MDNQRWQVEGSTFQQLFCLSWYTDDGCKPSFTSRLEASNDTSIHLVQFDEVKVIAAARRIRKKNSLSAGPDSYPTLLQSKLIGVLASPLSLIFNSFMSVGKLPKAWKSAIITPIHKGGSKSEVSNYRPVSQTSVFCKLLERVFVADVSDYLLAKNLISN
jgi:hypothetical protein